MAANTRMLGVKNCAKRMPPRSVNRDPPWSELNSSRNIIGKAMVKNAENGFRQNSRFWYQNWRASRDRAPGRRPRIALAAGLAAALAAVSAIGDLLGGDGLGVAGELQVDVLQGGARDGQGLELLAAADRPAGQQVEGRGRRLGPQLHVVVVDRRLGRQPGWQVGHGEARGQPEADHRLGQVAAAERVRAALRHDRAAGQDHHPVGQVLGLVHVVRGQQDALAEGAQVVDQLPGVAPGRGVEPGGGLVQEDQIRVADDPERQVEPALLPTRERLDSRVALLREAHQVHGLVHVPRGREEAAVEVDQLPDGQVPVQARGLERIGIVLQSSGLDRNLTVRELVYFYGGFFPAPRNVDETVDLVGLAEKRDSRVKALSGGQQRRLDLALGIVGDPDLIFLDEPTTGFDPSARRHSWELVDNLRSLGKSILLTTHYMDEAQNLADRVVVLAGGAIVAEGSPDSLGGRDLAEAVISFRLPSGLSVADLPAGLPAQPPVHDNHVQLRTQAPTAALNLLTGWAVGRGEELEALTVTRPSLEDVYLQLTGDAEAVAPKEVTNG